MATKAEHTIDLPVPAAQAFDLTYRALGALAFSMTNVDPASGTIDASTSMNATSWGENLLVNVQPVTATTSTVIVRSALKFGLVDWGRNKKNVVRVEQAIRQQLAAAPPPPPGAAHATAAIAPGWHPDPSGRHHHRWWDGEHWTDVVSTDGTTSTDPLPPS